LRFLDIAVAVMVGIASMAGLAAWSPRGGDALSYQSAVQVRLRDELVHFLDSRGLPWILQARAVDVCTALATDIAPPDGAQVNLGGASCGSQPPAGAVVAELTLNLLPMAVVLEAWSPG
jgi:hypothetical protein